MPSYRTTPDGKDYRLVITVTDEVTTCVIERIREGTWVPVSYTHLTLPTICSV